MTDGVIIAIVTGIFSVIAVIVSNAYSNRKVQGQIQTAQAVTDTKITELTREVREHNNFAKRVPVLEEKIAVANKRISDLEQKP